VVNDRYLPTQLARCLRSLGSRNDVALPRPAFLADRRHVAGLIDHERAQVLELRNGQTHHLLIHFSLSFWY
jgi:hypothetical protein